MRSIREEIDPAILAAQVRMERQTHKGAFVLLEGSSDVKRFRRFFQSGSCSLINCFGKANVVGAIERLYDDGYEGCLGLIDADFDRIRGILPKHEGLVPSQTHDFDLDAACTSMLLRYLHEVADEGKLQSYGGAENFLDSLIRAIRPLSAMRYANEKHQLGYSLSGIRLSEFFDGSSIDIGRMIDHVVWGDDAERKATLRSHIDRYSASQIDDKQATSGHDVCEALGIALRTAIGNRVPPQTWRSEIELHMRLAYDLNHFEETGVVQWIRKWEAASAPYKIL